MIACWFVMFDCFVWGVGLGDVNFLDFGWWLFGVVGCLLGIDLFTAVLFVSVVALSFGCFEVGVGCWGFRWLFYNCNYYLFYLECLLIAVELYCGCSAGCWCFVIFLLRCLRIFWFIVVFVCFVWRLIWLVKFAILFVF